ncbi:Solute carrier family 2, facilitated glucose transporter member 2 [Thelohanellus kitauei]|uniref:Solute carrier family 2, facilitated glucose transporter member 2 n=1 Tax=Thelohanellus kitauei TaxID=669202 RepID=A0A0C2I819_THEKT|nr:Solute carrier family 2, facilitated glucose transporter member 2 [Thelohanellus kitauei]
MESSTRLGAYTPYLLTLIPILFGLVISLAGNRNVITRSFTGLSGDKWWMDVYWVIAMTMFPVGGTIGSTVPLLAPKTMSRKLILNLANVLGILGSVVYYLSYFLGSYICFVMSRLVHGTTVGVLMSFGIVTYLQMVIPKQARIASTFVQPLINFGVVLSSIMNLNAIIGDRWLISITPLVVTQILMFLVLIILPESPIFYMQISRDKLKVARLLGSIRPKNWNSEKEAEHIHIEVSKSAETEYVSLMSFLTTNGLKMPIFVVCMVSIGQIFSGVNVLVLYASKFVEDAKIEPSDVGMVVIMLVGLIGSIIFAVVIPRSGNKPMMVLGHLMMGLSFVIASYLSTFHNLPWVCLGFLCLYLFFFQSGPGSLPWVIFQSTFEPKYQATAQGLLSLLNWTSNALVMAFGVTILESLGINVLLFFGILNILFAIFFQIFMVETKGKTYSQIIEEYSNRF